MRYVTRRIIFYLIAIFASLTINFFIPRLMPGDPASAMFARFQGQMRPEAITALREAFGFEGTAIRMFFRARVDERSPQHAR